ncbi:MAG: hypothetical protein WC876_01540 [Candidatus Thermoplasmatota archaeon]
MAFSKFDPTRPQERDGLGASNPSAARRARFLKWANWIVLVYTALGFGIIAYLIATKV